MNNEAASKPAIEQTQPPRAATRQLGSDRVGQTSRPVQLTQTAVFSACVLADSSFRF